MSYSKNIESNNRALFVFLIDQSYSTGDDWGSSGDTISYEITRRVNETIHELVNKGNDGRFRDRYDFACIGYGGDASSAFSGTLSHQDIVSCTDLNDNFELSDYCDFIIETNGRGSTNMAVGFTKVKEVIEHWLTLNNHMDSFPPMVFHITDAESNGDDPMPIINEIKQLKTHDGNVLVWSLHVSPKDSDREDMFLKDDSALTDDLAKNLFAMSSQIPHGAFGEYGGCQAFGYNLKPENFIKLLKIGTLR